MTALEATFAGLALLAFAGMTWVLGVIAWRLLRSPRK